MAPNSLSATLSPSSITDETVRLFRSTDLFSCPAGGLESQLDFEFDPSVSVLTIRKPGMNAGDDWTVTLK